MTARHVPALIVALAGTPGLAAAQSTHLSALESSRPAAVVEPTAGAFDAGLGGLWADPTTAPRVTGGFFSIYQSSYAEVRVLHTALAFRLGPRWSVTYGSAEIGNLFDTLLTSQDPSLAQLRARALWAGVDATVSLPRASVSVGVAFAGDENVGDVRSSTVARASARLSPFRGKWLALGLDASWVVGGSIAAPSTGRQTVDIVVSREIGGIISVSVSGAASRGSLWRYSETRGGVAVAAKVTVLSSLDLGIGAGRYDVTFGTSTREWYRSAAAGLLVGPVRVNVQYTSTQLGLGSGTAVSVGYESR